MVDRTYKVGDSSVKDKHTGLKKIIAYFVTDAHDETELDDRPQAATFPISAMYDGNTQYERAERFAEYMNKLAEAARIAREQTHLVDILSRP